MTVPAGRLAADNDAAAKIRADLAKKLREGKPIEIASSGDVTGQTGEKPKLVTQPGKLATENDAAAKIRADLAKKLREGKPIEIASSGDVTGQTGEKPKLVTQPGKLAYTQWYERDPQRLADEKELMHETFPQFELGKLEDGRLYWNGSLKLNVLPNGWPWEIAAIYTNDHPQAVMGSSVRVLLLNPSIEQVIDALGYRPHHLLYDEQDGTYLCTTRAEDVSVGTSYETTAAQTLTWAVKWLTALELVLAGDLSPNLFNKPDGI